MRNDRVVNISDFWLPTWVSLPIWAGKSREEIRSESRLFLWRLVQLSLISGVLITELLLVSFNLRKWIWGKWPSSGAEVCYAPSRRSSESLSSIWPLISQSVLLSLHLFDVYRKEWGRNKDPSKILCFIFHKLHFIHSF